MRSFIYIKILIGFCLLSLNSSKAETSAILFEQELLASDASAIDKFGTSVSIDGHRAMIVGLNKIYAFEFGPTGWVETQIIDNPSTRYASVSLSGNRMVLGSAGDDEVADNAGAAFIYELENGLWTEKAKLMADDGTISDFFGSSVSLDNNTVLIGTPYDDINGQYTGSVYVFAYDGKNWVHTNKLLPKIAVENDYFGYSVSINDEVAVIGTRDLDFNGNNPGAAYVFERFEGQWVQTKKLIADEGNIRDGFGHSVGVHNGTIIVGSSNSGETMTAGAAFIFEKLDGKWVKTERLVANDSDIADHFGFAVSIHNNQALVGAFLDNSPLWNAGSAYLFEIINGKWSQINKITAPEQSAEDQFGFSVSLSNGRSLIGSEQHDTTARDDGAAFIYIVDVLFMNGFNSN